MNKRKPVGVWKREGKRGVRYRARWRDHTGKQRSGTYKTESAAKEAFRRGQVEASDILSGKSQAPIDSPTLTNFVDKYTRLHVAVENKPSERKSKEKIFRLYLLPAFGKLTLDQITLESIRELVAKLGADGLSKKTVNNVLTCLRSTLRYAHKLGALASVPEIKTKRVSPDEIDFLTFAELEQLLSGCDEDVLAAVLLGADAGLRSGEIRALHWEHVDFERKKLRIVLNDFEGTLGTTKGDRPRDVPMTARLGTALRAVRHLRGQLVFADQDGHLRTEKAMTYALRKACRKAKLREIGWHTLRHTFCSHLAMLGAPARAIQDLAGHADLATTQRYLHLSPNSTRLAIDLLEGRCAKPVPETA